MKTETIEVKVVEKQYPPSTFTKPCDLPAPPLAGENGITNEQFALSMIEHRAAINECNINLMKIKEWTRDDNDS